MALEIIKNINVDFYDDRYTLINTKQYDGSSRYITVTCYNQGKIFNLNSNKHTAYVRYKKADGHTVFNFCTITTKGQIEIELTEQMLTASGICDVDLVVVNKGNAIVNIDTGEIIAIDDSEILSTMVFRIYVYESAVDNSLIESSDEYNGLNNLLAKAEADYKNVINASEIWALTSQSWAIGKSGIEGRKEIEDTDNAKYYCEESGKSANQSSISAGKSEDSAKAADGYMKKAEEYKNMANNSASDASTSEHNASISETNASNSASSASQSASNAYNSASSASNSASSASQSASSANQSASIASNRASMASVSEANALSSANKSQSYAIGGTGTRENEEISNARYYYEKIVTVAEEIMGGFIPIGTIKFDELATAEKVIGYVYNISDDFVTDSSFRDGEGKSYTAGTNVYYTANGEWDCLGGASSPTATVDEVKEYLGI